MDGSRFDALARAAARTPSRRALLGAALGGLTAVLLGNRVNAAQVLRRPGEICRKDGECASGVCGPKNGTGRQYCQCTGATQCPQPKAGNACYVAACTQGTCGTVVNTGAACDDGNACTSGTTCQADGSCGGGTATTCTALDQCHTPGVCQPGTGACTDPAKPNGTLCDAGTGPGTGTCQNGACACTPANTCPSGVCGSAVSDGCNGTLDCSTNCASGFICSGGLCVDDPNICIAGENYCTAGGGGRCGAGACFCAPALDGSTKCIAQFYEGSLTCGNCTTDADCVPLTNDPLAVCMGVDVLCGSCASNGRGACARLCPA